MSTNDEREALRELRRMLPHHEARVDAQANCVPCKLCGGKAVIMDAGIGAGYYIKCENSGAFRAAQGCMITERRLGGSAYNVMDWWNRLHSFPAPQPPAPGGDEVPEGWVGIMGTERAIYFLERFKREERMLGPHEQWALNYAIAALANHSPDTEEGAP